MSNEQPPVRKVIPYKSGKRPSTFRRLKIDFAGTALEEALNKQERQQESQLDLQAASPDPLPNEQVTDDGPVSTTPHHSPPLVEATHLKKRPAIKEVSKNQDVTEKFESQEGEYPPLSTTPPLARKNAPDAIAPERDFNRRANSLERDAMPSGLFPGSTKKVYDALYLRTRGAIVPIKRIRASRKDLLNWTGIRNVKTIDNHLRYLMAKGLIVRYWELGSNEGSSYEVILPEELSDQYPPLPTSGGESPPLTTTQKLGIPTTQKLGSGGEGQITENKTTYAVAKTFNTNTEEIDDDEALADFVAALKRGAEEVTGRRLSQAEKHRWAELAEVLVTELKIAAGRTTVSSAPAFLAEHLRRRLWKKDKRQIEAEAVEQKPEQPSRADASKCPDCFGTGMYYPEGYDRGVAKCQHRQLTAQDTV